MKKGLLFFIMLACMSLALCAFVGAQTLDADELSDIKGAIENATEGETVTVTLVSDVVVPNTSSAIKLEKNVTLIINTNGYTLYTNPGGGSAGTVYGILLNHGDAKLVINGTLTGLDAINFVVPSDEQLTVSNGAVVDPNDANGVKSPDFASNGPAIKICSGSIEFNNTYFRQYNSGEWGIYSTPNSGVDKLVTNVYLENSILRQPDNCDYGAFGERGGSYNISECFFQVDNSVIYGLKNDYWPLCKGSYIRNSRFKNSVSFDGYMDAAEPNAIPKDEPVEIINTVFESANFSVGGGTIRINLIDCQFPNGMSISVSSDRNGSGAVTMTKTATCIEAGKQVYITTTTSTPITSFDGFPNVNEQYSIDNPHSGHSKSGDALSISYKDGFGSKGYCDFVCAVCGERYTETVPTAPVIFVALGYSNKPENTGISAGFEIDNDALKAYEDLTHDTVHFGVVIFNPDYVTDERFFNGTEFSASEKFIIVPIELYTYSTASCLITGFDKNPTLDIVISAYAYSNENSVGLIQKQYQNGGVQENVFEKLDGTLYSVTMQSVMDWDPEYVLPENQQ